MLWIKRKSKELLIFTVLLILATVYVTRKDSKRIFEEVTLGSVFGTLSQPLTIAHDVSTDKTRTFGIITAFYHSEEQPMEHDVTLVTHMDISRIQNVITLADAFQGPIHTCIFITSKEMLNDTAKVITFVRNNSPSTKKHVNWHILYPLGNYGPTIERYSPYNGALPDSVKLSAESPNISATQFEKVLTELKENNVKAGLAGSTNEHISYYPHTIAMNVALNASTTLYFLCIDSDLKPSQNLRKKFVKFAENLNLYADAKSYPPLSSVRHFKHQRGKNFSCQEHAKGELPPKDIYVVPAFQSKDDILPHRMKDLRQSVQSGQTTHFFGGLYELGYGPTQHLKWLNLSKDDDNSPTQCLYDVNFSIGYEPFIIARKGIPIYDERFSGYSPVENHHKRLLDALGYKYVVLQNVFLVHRGWKTKGYRTEQKGKEQAAHAKPFQDFLRDMRKWRDETRE